MPSEPLDRLRAICLAFPEAMERETWGHATFRVREKIFAMAGDEDGRPKVSCKARAGLQSALVEGAPNRFFVPPYVGPKGWIGVYLGDETDWDELTDLIEESYRMTAPKRVAALLDQMADVIGVAEGNGEDLSSRTVQAFTDLLVERHRRQSGADDPD
jgi:predicted DNA-binding protein (MmcQ/YjbR family)